MTISSTFRFLRTRCVLTALQRNCITFMSWIFLSQLPFVRGTLAGKAYLPNGTYIDTLDFKTPKDLANVLTEIENDKTKYTKMLRAKDAYTSQPYSRTYEDAMCNPCQLLHRGNLNRPPLNVSHWFFVDSCREPLT